jgi:hypothetical protein
MHGNITARIVIEVYEDGAMSVKYPVDDKAWVLAALDNARDAVRGKMRADNGETGVIIPHNEVTLP